MSLYNSKSYLDDINKIAKSNLPWNLLENKTIVLSGATGLLGSFFIDVLMKKAIACTVYALGRSKKKIESRFSNWLNDKRFIFVPYDANLPFDIKGIGTADFVFHLASNTHPLQYATDPIGTITTNIIGLQHMLNFAVAHNTSRFVFASSVEIYGENRGDVKVFNEEYCGYIDSNTLRAGYPESKRCGEALCQAYRSQKGLDVVIARFARSYGPTMQMSDTKAISQFIRNGVAGQDIILKSAGTQNYSYTYMADAVYGLLTVVLKGENGNAYNIADDSSDITLKDLASVIANHVGKEVIFNLPDKTEAAGYSKATTALLDGSKLKSLGWKPFYRIEDGIQRTIDILREIQTDNK